MLLEKARPSLAAGDDRRLQPAGHPDPEALIEEARRWERRRRYKRAGFGLGLVAVLALAFGIVWSSISGGGSSGGDAPSLAASLNNEAAASGPLYGISHPVARPSAPNSTVGRVSEQTLAFVGKRLHLEEGFSPGPFSPDQTQLLLVNGMFGAITFGTSPLAVVDLRTMSLERDMETRLTADLRGERVTAATWPTANRILVVAARPRTKGSWFVATSLAQTLVAIDPKTGAIEWRHALSRLSILDGADTVGTTTVLLFSAGARDPGKAVAMTVTPNGETHSSSLKLERGGYERTRTVTLPAGHKPRFRMIKLGRQFQQDLVTTTGRSPRAYVLTGGGVVYSIDPTTAKPSRHIVPTPAGSPNTSPEDMLTDAAPLNGKLVVSSFFPKADGTTRAGIYIIDPSSWTAQLVTPTTPSWTTSHSRLITFTNAGQFGAATAKSATNGTGISIYDANGNLRHQLDSTRAFTSLISTPLFDYAVLPAPAPTRTAHETTAQAQEQFASTRYQTLLFNPASGKILGRRTITRQAPALIQPAAEKQRR